MDLDAMGTRVAKLSKWKDDVDGVISKVKDLVHKLDAQGPAAVDTSATDELSRRVDALSDQVGLVSAVRGDVDTISKEVDDFRAKFPQERVDALDFMLTWFQDNQEALEVLLSVGDTAASAGDDPKVPVTGTVQTIATTVNEADPTIEARIRPVPGISSGLPAGTAIAGAQGDAGAVAAAAAPNAPAEPDAALRGS
jgi:hypothetical protein